MAITHITGNIFTSSAQTLVNTVNCVGVMGAGIALECRLRYPDMYAKYVKICEAGQLSPGKLWLYKSENRWVLNFPTKTDWKRPSQERYLHLGLQKFVKTYKAIGIESIAFPLLGADKGGLSRDRSISILEEHLANLKIPIEIYSYDPRAHDDLYEQFKTWVLSGGTHVLAADFKVRADILKKLVTALESPDTYQLNQLGRTRGVGIKTLEKVFHAARISMNRPTQVGLDL
jgi:O-acetyl-ADP-ribose deacetylase (regulator of RNase III)